MKISVVVLTYNGWEYTHQLLMDIKANCQNVHEVIVVDNGSEDHNVKLGLEFWLGMNTIPLRVFHLAINRGFIGGMNYGLSKVRGDVAALLSNDVRIVSSNFIDEIENVFTENENILFGPTLYTQNTGWNVFGNTTIPYVEGYCLVATKKFWNTCSFDEIFSPSDFEDVDLSMQAVSNGFELKQMKRGIVIHLGGKTLGYNEFRANRTKRNQKLFANKWSLK